MSLGKRSDALERIGSQAQWDLVVVGGGITGAGVVREAARRGLNVLLLEQRDFSWGTSSRSSKMVHGGLRYIAQGDFRLTRDALLERERLLAEGPGLVERMGYLFPVRGMQFPGRFSFSALLEMYDRFARIRDHRWMKAPELLARVPGLSARALKGACYYTDAVTDDSRLVLRTLQEAVADGAVIANYLKVTSLLKNGGLVRGVVVEDVQSGRCYTINASAVISATGAWADRLRGELVQEKRVRPLRGSHIVVKRERLPVRDALTLLHPKDRRPVFVFPWEGMTVIGTTDLDHPQDMDIEASITREEVEYLYDAVSSQFSGARLTDAEVISSWSGVRPVIGSETSKDPSKERRDHAVWADKGLVTVSGGKLTIFRLIALDALRAARPWLNHHAAFHDDGAAVFSHNADAATMGLFAPGRRRLLAGRYGSALKSYSAIEGARGNTIEGTPYSVADVVWALREEQCSHLDDLLLRRTRLGNLLPDGGSAIFPLLKPLAQRELGWSDAVWEAEVARYAGIWRQHYALPA
jgi:glycerol-3-phosphate dehydrogenase